MSGNLRERVAAVLDAHSKASWGNCLPSRVSKGRYDYSLTCRCGQPFAYTDNKPGGWANCEQGWNEHQADAVLVLFAQEWRERREELIATATKTFQAESVKPDKSTYGGGRKPSQVIALTVDSLSAAFFGVSEGSREP